jgi:hypothetical protein
MVLHPYSDGKERQQQRFARTPRAGVKPELAGGHCNDDQGCPAPLIDLRRQVSYLPIRYPNNAAFTGYRFPKLGRSVQGPLRSTKLTIAARLPFQIAFEPGNPREPGNPKAPPKWAEMARTFRPSQLQANYGSGGQATGVA